MQGNTTLSKILQFCTVYPQPIKSIADAVKLPYQTVYHAIARNTENGIFKTEKIDGLLWARALTTPARIDLIRGMQNSNFCKNDIKHPLPYRCGNERRTATRLSAHVINIKTIQSECIENFREYLHRINNLKIVMIPNPEKDFLGEALYLDYKTRFNDAGRKVEALKRYEQCWDVASQRHKVGVMITLTTDPKLQTSLWTANKKASGNLNRLLSKITKDKGSRPEYVNVTEYQKNGRIHYHLMIFGHKWIMQKEKLSELWHKYGQGEIVDFLSIKNDGPGWTWTRQKPADADGKSPIDYLKKYLKKGLFDPEKLYQYWIYNQRFFSYSRALCIIISYKISRGWYIFIGTISYEESTEEDEETRNATTTDKTNIEGIQTACGAIAKAMEIHLINQCTKKDNPTRCGITQLYDPICEHCENYQKGSA